MRRNPRARIGYADLRLNLSGLGKQLDIESLPDENGELIQPHSNRTASHAGVPR